MQGIYITLAYALLMLLAVSCQSEIAPRNSAPPLSAKSSSNSPASQGKEEEDTINLKMTAHATQLVFAAEDFKSKDLSETHVREIKAWWDSLPQPLQSRVKSNAVAVEVVSNVVASPNTQCLSQKSDNKIEQTGAALEKVIGTTTEMTYTVNTTVVEKVSTSAPSSNNNPKNSEATATTNILLVETVAVKLSQFALDLPLQDMTDLSTETAQALQYWWTSLPEDLQNKIRQQEISIQLNVCSIDRGVIGKHNQKPILGLNADTKLTIVEDILHRIIGTYRAGTRTIALAKINAATPSIEKLGSHNAHIRSDQYLRLQLRSNRTAATTAPSAM